MATKNKRKIPEKQIIRLGQLNARGSRAVTDEIRQLTHEQKLDILLLQEPYCFKNNIQGLGLDTKTVVDKKRFSKITTAERVKAAIVILNKNINVLKLEQYSNTHCICVEASTSTDSLYIISAYFQHCDSIKPYLDHLDKVIRALKGNRIVLGIDANANSTLWYSKDTDQRGEALEEFIAQHGLYIVNELSETHTFDNIHGQANIDVTLASNPVINKVKNWRVLPNQTLSDHNLIRYDIETTIGTIHCTKGSRFNIKRADWEKFADAITNARSTNHTEQAERHVGAQEFSTKIETIITNASNGSIPKKTRFTKSAPWWNQSLTALRSEARRARRIFQREKNGARRQTHKQKYNELHNKYTTAIRRSKQGSWRKLVTNEGNSDPWGIVYKIQTKKLKIEKVPETIKLHGAQTKTWRETMENLLDALIPNDSTANETESQKRIREQIETPPTTEDTPPFTEEEVKTAIKSMKNKKAPGQDLLETEIIKSAWSTLGEEIIDMYNRCLSQGVFPRQWKQAVIRILLKSEDKDVTEPRSYRPISLLPVLGKILEKLVVTRLGEIINNHPRTSNRQYGFKPGCSTETAIVKLRNIIKQSQDKYAIGLLFDITGAFDNVWWPSILNNLKKRDCPRNLYQLLQNYLSDRSAKIVSNGTEIEKIVNKGCPQGSILGPQFWKLIFDEIIEKLKNSYEVIAYADDLIIVITGKCRIELQNQANAATKILLDWCTEQKLQVSKSKSEMILLKGTLDIRRPPTVKIHDTSMKMVQSTTYLGLHIGTRFNITPHVNHICNKTKKIFNLLVHVARAKWGINTKNMNTLYKGIFIPIITYAATGWADKLNVHHKRSLVRTQRHALLTTTKAYRTISNDALCVLAAAIPIDLILKEREVTYKLRNNIQCEMGNLRYTEQESPPTKKQLRKMKSNIRKESVG